MQIQNILDKITMKMKFVIKNSRSERNILFIGPGGMFV